MSALSASLLLLAFAIRFIQVDGLYCYSCTASSPESDCELYLDEMNMNEVKRKCRPQHKYCSIVRVEKANRPGVAASFLRGCETTPVVFNSVIEDSEQTTFYTSCQTDYCNVGPGNEVLPSGGSGSGHEHPPLPPYELLVGSVSMVTISVHLVILAPIALLLCYHL